MAPFLRCLLVSVELNAILLEQVMRKNTRTIERISKVFLGEVGQLFGLAFILGLELIKVNVLKNIINCAFCTNVPAFYDLKQMVFTIFLALNIISYKLVHRFVIDFPVWGQSAVETELFVKKSFVLFGHFDPNMLPIHGFFIKKTIEMLGNDDSVASVGRVNRPAEKLGSKLNTLRTLGSIARVSSKLQVSWIDSGDNEAVKINEVVDELVMSYRLFLSFGFGGRVMVGSNLSFRDEVLVPAYPVLVTVVVRSCHCAAYGYLSLSGEDNDINKFFGEWDLFLWDINSLENSQITAVIARIFSDNYFA